MNMLNLYYSITKNTEELWSSLLESKDDDDLCRRVPNIALLFDESLGKGVSSVWRTCDGFDGIKVGYAGGLKPTNIRNRLEDLQTVVDDREVWIDMENGVRIDDHMSLDLVKQVIDIVCEMGLEPQCEC